MVSDLEPSFLVSGTLEAPPVFSYARALAVATRRRAGAISFLQSGAASYAVAPGRGRTSAASEPSAPARSGRRSSAAPSGDGGSARTGRVDRVRRRDFASNGVIEFLGNKDLLVNSVNWLARDDSLISARAQQKELGREQFFVTEAQGRMAFWLAAVVQPALFFAARCGRVAAQAVGMSWRRVGVIYLVLAVLAGYLAVFERRQEQPSPTEGVPSLEQSLLGAEANAVGAVTFRRAGTAVHAVREGERWRVLDPPRSGITPDLIAAVVATLTAGQVSEVMEAGRW